MRSYTSKRNGDAPALKVEFELDGVQFQGSGTVSMLDMSEFARLATQGVNAEDPSSVAILADIYLSLLGESEYQRFRAHVRRQNTHPEVLLAILGDMAGEQTSRPTNRSSDSSDGPPPAPATARAVSFSQRTVTEVPAEQATQPERKVVSYG